MTPRVLVFGSLCANKIAFIELDLGYLWAFMQTKKMPGKSFVGFHLHVSITPVLLVFE